MTSEYMLNWADVAFGSKKALKALRATFIAAPREISPARFTQLIKTYLPKGNMVLGISKEPYILGFEGQPHFRALAITAALQKLIDKVNAASPKRKIYTLSHSQRDTKYILQSGDFQKTLFVNGSWQYAFHNGPLFATMMQKASSYELLSPFADEEEALAYNRAIEPAIQAALWPAGPRPSGTLSEAEMLDLARTAGKQSFDYTYQCGVVMGKKTSRGYKYLLHTFNKVVPFQTYALHYGASREQHFSPTHDLNHYDTVHAEVEAVVQAGRQGINLKGTTLFIGLLPCPFCARMIAETDIAEVVYSADHSAGYAIHMLEKAGKTVRRIVPELQSGSV